MRLLVAVACLAVAAAAVVTLVRHEDCEGAREALFLAAVDGQVPQDAVRTAREACRGTTGLLAAAGALRDTDRAQALELAREAARAEPDNAAAWRAVAATASGREARAAERRWARLDPVAYRRSTR